MKVGRVFLALTRGDRRPNNSDALMARKWRNLVDALDSGSSRRKPVGVQVPPFALHCLPWCLLLSLVLACQSEAERLQAETVYHLESALRILEETRGNTDAAVSNLEKYLSENRLRMAETKTRGHLLMSRMAKEERDAFSRRAMERTRPLMERIETLARTYPDPPRIMAKLREFM